MPLSATSLRRLIVALPLLVHMLAPGALRAQGGRADVDRLGPVTRTLAIRNARIVQAPGRILERGTVIIRNGVIVDVGGDLAIPVDAEIIEGDTLTLYAGFIDGMTTAGIAPPVMPADTVAVRAPGDPPYARAGIRPERNARGMILADAPAIDTLRRAGFTLLQVVPPKGMLPGSGTLLLSGAGDPQRNILRPVSALHLRLEPNDEIYPATTMGVMARLRTLLRQSAERSRQLAGWNGAPFGIERPLEDPVLDALAPVMRRERPILALATAPLDVARLVRLERELGFDLMLAGVRDLGSEVGELKRHPRPLFLSLDLPMRHGDSVGDSTAPPRDTIVGGGLSGEGGRQRGERQQLEARQFAERIRLFREPARLASEGLRFGFSTAGATPSNVRGALVRIVAEGLSEERALAALTVDAASMLGLSRTLGTIEKGRMGNLVLTRGSYFADTGRVVAVVVEGRMFDVGGSKPADAKPLPGGTHAADSLVHNRVLEGRASARAGTLLVRNGTVVTVTGETFDSSDVLIVDGRIRDIGRGLSAPAGGMVIDATGRWVTPGIVDAHSHIAIDDVNEWTNPVTAEVAVGDVLNPTDINIYRALAGGVTTSHLMHGSANVIGGQCRTIKHRYGVTDPEELVMEGATRTIKFALGENPTRVHGRGFGVQPSTRMGVEQVMRRAFAEAKLYEEARRRYETGEKGITSPPPYDLRMETLAAILRGDVLVHCHSYRADEILMVMRVFRDFGIERVVFQHVNEGFKVAPELAKFGAMASVFSDWWAYKFEVYYSTAYNAAILTRNGVVTSINSDSPELNRHLPHEAAKTIRYGGLTPKEAMSLVTINPARQLGIDDRVGSIEVGKEGDLAIFTAPPTSVYAVCTTTIVDGVVRFDRERDPDDMRMSVDLERSVETMENQVGEEETVDRCMQGTEHLFEGRGR